MTLTRVQGNARGTSTGNSIGVTLSAAPASGNILIAVIGTFAASYATINGISQTGVTWTHQKSSQAATSNPYYMNCEIWAGVVGSGASQSLTVNLAANAAYGGIADVCEYLELSTSNFLDQTASNNDTSGSNPTDTGTTSVTQQPSELAIGASFSCGGATTQSSPNYYFTLLDGATYGSYTSLGYLEKILSATGTQNSGATTSTASWWVGCIATFKATSGSGTASKLAYTAGDSQSVTAGSVSSIITVQVQDSNNNPVTSGANVSLSTSSSGTFYSDSGGSTQITSIAISSGQSSGSFYYKDTTTGTPTLTASSTGLTSATTQFTIINQSGGLFISKTTSTDTWLGSKVNGDTQYRYIVEADGKIRWGPGGTSNSDVILQRSDLSQTNPPFWSYPLLTLYRGNGTTAGDLQLGTLIFRDSGGIITILENNTTRLDTKQGYTPQGDYAHLFCTKISPLDRTTVLDDPKIATDFAFFVEKDLSTFGFVSTTSDPQKGYGGGAILMGIGLTGVGCPPLFDLTGTMPNGTSSIGSYPTSQNPNDPSDWWYDSTNKQLKQGSEPMFNNVYSGEYDTLFLMRADTQGPANLYSNILQCNKIHNAQYSWVEVDSKLNINGNFQLNGNIVTSLNPDPSVSGTIALGSPDQQYQGAFIQSPYVNDIYPIPSAKGGYGSYG
jgi:hypothetical protein